MCVIICEYLILPLLLLGGMVDEVYNDILTQMACPDYGPACAKEGTLDAELLFFRWRRG